jgi:hypothetical protein
LIGVFSLEESPALENEIFFPESLPNPRRKGTASSPKGGLLCGVALHFFVMVFVAHTRQHLYFFKRQEKNTRAVANARTKTHAKKDVGKLNNIMWHYSIFYLRSCKHANPQEKNPITSHYIK